MALTTLYNSTNHPLTWDKVNEVLKVVDDNFTFVSSQATTGVLTNLSQDITPNSVGTWDLGTPTQRWDNIYANSIDVGSISSDITGSIFAQTSAMMVDGTEGKIVGDVDNSRIDTNYVYGPINGSLLLGYRTSGSTVAGISISNTNKVQILQNSDFASGSTVDFTGATITGFAGNTSGNAATVTNGVYTIGDQTIAGIKTFSSTIKGNIQGNVTGNVVGNVVGDVVGSVYSDDSSGVLVDGLHGVLNTSKLDQVGAQNGEALVWSDSNGQWEPGVVSGGGGTSLGTRTTKAASTSSIADGAIGNTIVQGAFSAYMLLKIQVDAAAWVRIYTDQASRTADASRAETTDPSPGAGVVAEIITTGSSTVLISPAVMGFNNESPVTTDIPIAVKNKSGSTTAITVTLTLIQMEA